MSVVDEAETEVAIMGLLALSSLGMCGKCSNVSVNYEQYCKIDSESFVQFTMRMLICRRRDPMIRKNGFLHEAASKQLKEKAELLFTNSKRRFLLSFSTGS